MIPAERVRELVDDLKRRASSCSQLVDRQHEPGDCQRLVAKASAYHHAAEMVEQLLKDEPGTVPAGGER